ncbi:MAG: glycosyltransferase family 4 protein, partial [Candidatus Omnitrophica bacterium]|nr:glycosyltransferase family 4 protein [Candidatus Omnitrophota bacterium]
TLPMISVKVSSNPLQIYRIIPKFFSCLKKERPDVIHAFEYGSYSTDIAYFYAKKYKIPFLLTVYGYQFSSLLLKISKKIYDRIIGRFLFKNAYKIFFSSETQRKEILRIIKRGNIEDKIILQENSIRMDNYRNIVINKRLLNKYKPDGEVILLAVVRLLPRKGIKYLIHALHKIKADHKIQNIKLIIAGPDCGELVNIKNLVKVLGLENSVSFTGPIAPHRVREFLGICDIFVLPSLYEGLPLALLEAMAAGKAVIFSDIPCAGRLIANNDNGLLIKPADADSLSEAIIRLSGDKNLRDRLGLKAREAVKVFDSRIEAKNIREFYKQALIIKREHKN